MHSFGNSAGFRRSTESLFSGPQSARIPAAATGWLQLSLVSIDPSVPQTLDSGPTLRQAAADAPLVPGFTGLLVQYEEFVTANELSERAILNTRDLSRVRPGLLANIVTGAGIKVWLKNLPAVTDPSRRAYAAETRVTMTSLVVGSPIRWTGTVFALATAPANTIGTVTRVTATGIEFTLSV